MRPLVLALTALVAGSAREPASAADADTLVHAEQGARVRIEIEQRGHYRRLLFDNTLHGTQFAGFKNHWADEFSFLTAAHPLENIVVAGALTAFDARQEPLTYHHRSGPVGAVYHELRTRKNGADASAPVAVIGLTAGTQAAYARRGQKFVFYEGDPTVVKLVADTDRYFTYVADARKRGADLVVRVGTPRAKLKEDKDQKYAAIFVDISDSFPIPKDILTKEAVTEYFDRLTDDGLVALHVSNKYLRLEPMVAKMAEELKLAARIWNDDGEGLPGKTASSWVVLARTEKALGPRIGSPLGKLVDEYGSSAPLVRVIGAEFPGAADAVKANPNAPQAALLAWLDGRPDDPKAREYARLVRAHSMSATLMTALRAETGTGFRPVDTLPHVTAWTDARADVFVLWGSPNVQALRRLFGHPTPIDR